MESSNSGDASIQDQRAKSNLLYREAIAPGLDSEMTLKAILASTESAYQKIDVLETYFGKVRKKMDGDKTSRTCMTNMF